MCSWSKQKFKRAPSVNLDSSFHGWSTHWANDIGPVWLLTGRATEQLIKSHSLKQGITEFLPSSFAAHLKRIPVLHQQLWGEIYPGKLVCHWLDHQLSDCLCPTGSRLAHHESKVASHSSPHHVQNSANDKEKNLWKTSMGATLFQ